MRLTGSTPLVNGQQSYAITFSPAFAVAPVFFPSVQMASSSGELFTVNADTSTLTATGVTVWLSGIPTASSGSIVWEAVTSSAGTVTSGGGQGGITVPQLFHRIARRSRTGDFTKLSMTEQTDLAEAANTALQKLYNALPAYFKELTEGFVLPAPAAISGVGVTQYSKTVTANTFTAAQLGATVRLNGDPQWNQVTGTGTLLNPYMGSTGSVAGTVYGDSIFSSIYPLDRIIGNPRFPNNGGLSLIPMGLMQSNQAPYIWQQSIGQPRFWWVQTFGNSQGNAPFVVLKFAPVPDTAYAISARIGFWPKRITLADYQAASTLVVPSQFIEPALIPLAMEAFMTSPAYKVFGDEDRIFDNARRAEAYLRGQPAQVGAPSNRIFTPAGF